MAKNKIIYGNDILIDLTSDSVTSGTLAQGATAHDKGGNQIVGVAELKLKSEVINETLIFYDADFYKVNSETVIVGNRIDSEMFTIDL